MKYDKDYYQLIAIRRWWERGKIGDDAAAMLLFTRSRARAKDRTMAEAIVTIWKNGLKK